MPELIPEEAVQAAARAIGEEYVALREWDPEAFAKAALEAAASFIAEQARAEERAVRDDELERLRKHSDWLSDRYLRTDREATGWCQQATDAEVRAEGAEAALARVDAVHQPTQTGHWIACATHGYARDPDCSRCCGSPIWTCTLDACGSWPCATHLALQGETEETCAHRGGVEDANKLANSHADDFGEVSDGHGNAWPLCSADCGLHVVRPGRVQCGCERKDMPL